MPGKKQAKPTSRRQIARHAKNARLPASLFPAGGTEGDAVDSTAIEQSEDVDDAEQGASQLPAKKPPISSAAGISRTSSGMSRGSTMSAGQEEVLGTIAAAHSDSIAARSAKRIHRSDITTYTTPSGIDLPDIATHVQGTRRLSVVSAEAFNVASMLRDVRPLIANLPVALHQDVSRLLTVVFTAGMATPTGALLLSRLRMF